MGVKTIQGALNVTDDIQLNGTSIVGSGSGLYQHFIIYRDGGNTYNNAIKIINTRSTPYTYSELGADFMGQNYLHASICTNYSDVDNFFPIISRYTDSYDYYHVVWHVKPGTVDEVRNVVVSERNFVDNVTEF